MMIGQLEAETGVPSSTIRYWEPIGVAPKPLRVGAQRRYGPEVVHYLAVLRLAQACGFHVDEMRHLFHRFPSSVPASRRWQELSKTKIQELDEQIARLKTIRRVVNRALQCQWVELPECGRIAASVMEPVAE
jgi:MerR family transcriptional regulator, redox-sensitive transcriptional activator SoxR